MTKKLTPKLIIKYLIKEFCVSLLIFSSIFLTLILLSNFIEEIVYFRDKNVEGNFIVKTFFLSLIQVPTIFISMLPFIFLFSGIFFFVKLIKTNEITPLSFSGFSKSYITLIPSIFSFLIGIMIILLITPISSELSKYYETTKQKYSSNDNLIIINNTGLWIKERQKNFTYLIRADSIQDQNFKNLKNLTIYKFDNKTNFLQRTDADNVTIEGFNWYLKGTKTLFENKNLEEETKSETISNNNSQNFKTQIDFDKIKFFFSNADTFSFWNILDQIKSSKNIGYYSQELVIKFNKFISLPIMLFLMVIVSTIFTLNANYQFNNFIYTFFGVLTGIVIYFLSDLSIALGKSGRIPLILSVWVPILLIMILSTINLIKNND